VAGATRLELEPRVSNWSHASRIGAVPPLPLLTCDAVVAASASSASVAVSVVCGVRVRVRLKVRVRVRVRVCGSVRGLRKQWGEVAEGGMNAAKCGGQRQEWVGPAVSSLTRAGGRQVK